MAFLIRGHIFFWQAKIIRTVSGKEMFGKRPWLGAVRRRTPLKDKLIFLECILEWCRISVLKLTDFSNAYVRAAALNCSPFRSIDISMAIWRRHLRHLH